MSTPELRPLLIDMVRVFLSSIHKVLRAISTRVNRCSFAGSLLEHLPEFPCILFPYLVAQFV